MDCAGRAPASTALSLHCAIPFADACCSAKNSSRGLPTLWPITNPNAPLKPVCRSSASRRVRGGSPVLKFATKIREEVRRSGSPNLAAERRYESESQAPNSNLCRSAVDDVTDGPRAGGWSFASWAWRVGLSHDATEAETESNVDRKREPAAAGTSHPNCPRGTVGTPGSGHLLLRSRSRRVRQPAMRVLEHPAPIPTRSGECGGALFCSLG
jgi:hypothetical protein